MLGHDQRRRAAAAGVHRCRMLTPVHFLGPFKCAESFGMPTTLRRTRT